MTRFWSFATRSKMEKINIRCSSVDDLKTILSENHCKIQRAENHSKKGSVNKPYWSKMERVQGIYGKVFIRDIIAGTVFSDLNSWSISLTFDLDISMAWLSTLPLAMICFWTKKNRTFKSQKKQLNYHINFYSKVCSSCSYIENLKQIKV